jgi:hypothetical protein
MGFFGRDAGGHGQRDNLGSAGPIDVPKAAADRLEALGSDGMFSSAMSVAEFSLLSELGPQPLAQVMGTFGLPGRVAVPSTGGAVGNQRLLLPP